ncbi:F-box/LRR-repeat protein At4g14103-like isoform X2 [Miscanthus floridulus]|uniref:F-box/LRR-repeat protein At4g14103-like isoform X2 n=1 Tax=Miscanthus floridulus TaxID=154761 RepID=UPI00345A9187
MKNHPEQQQQQQRMEGEAAAKRSRLDHQRGLSDGSSFHMEDLPEEIQPLVLSLLSLKEVARTSLVSRNWRKLWTRYPNLCFDGSKDGPTDMDSVKIERAKFVETVNSIIQHHSGIGLNKFSVRFSLGMDSSDILNRWICFATASKAKIIAMNLSPKGNYLEPSKQVHYFPLEALGAQDGPFIQCLFLTNVSIKPHSDICGFTKLKSLHLHCIQIIGDLSGLLLNCSSLEDLEVIACSGVTDLNIPHQLNKLRHLLISNMRIQMVEFHVPNLSHFGYKGSVIPVVLHGCSKLQKATLTYHRTWSEEGNNKVLGHVFHGIPSVSAVKVLHVHANTYTDQPLWSSQAHSSITRPASMFLNLRHLTYEIIIFTKLANRHSGILQLAQYLSFVPQLETLEMHMLYHVSVGRCWRGDGISCHMRRHDHLKTVYMSGFRCYRAQVELLCGILEMGTVLEDVTIEPVVTIPWGLESMNFVSIPRDEICEWAHRTSQRFGKAITVAKRPPPR